MEDAAGLCDRVEAHGGVPEGLFGRLREVALCVAGFQNLLIVPVFPNSPDSGVPGWDWTGTSPSETDDPENVSPLPGITPSFTVDEATHLHGESTLPLRSAITPVP